MIWFVAFHPKRPEHWWARTFGHVSLAGYDNDTWVNLDLRREACNVTPIFKLEERVDFLSYLTAHSTVLKFGPSIKSASHFLRPMSCVSMTKHVLGVRSRALLPDSLFRDLRNNYSAEIMNEGQSTDRDRRSKAGAPTL